MLTQTVKRLEGMIPPENILIITNREQREAVCEVCPMLPEANVVAEPVGRDTAAAVGLATLLVEMRDPEGTFAMLPADHVIHDTAGFQATLATAFAAAEAEDALVTIGITAAYPATGYGYIHRGEPIRELGGHPVHAVRAFREKPELETAEAYVKSGEFFWNAGMFFWRVPVIAREFARQTPALWKALGAIRDGLKTGTALEALLEAHYPGLEKISIDYAIMEQAATVQMVESRFDWDDVGEWPAVERHSEADASSNVVRGQAILQDSSGNIVINHGDHLTTLIGLKDLIVVQTGDATLICPKDRAQEIKDLVKSIAKDPRFKNLL